MSRYLGTHRSLLRSFDPRDLLPALPALWIDPSDLSTLFQDSAGTTPVMADGDPVGLILDKSGNGYHAAQSTAANRPTYRTSGGFSWLEFDGVNDSLGLSGAGLNVLRNASAVTVVSGVKQNALGTLGVFFLATVATSTNTRFQTRTSASNTYEVQSRWDDVTGTTVSGGTVTGNSQVMTAIEDFATGGANAIKIRVDGAQVAAGTQSGAGNTPDAASQFVSIGSYAGIANYWNGRIGQLILFRFLLDAASLALVERYVGNKVGVSI